jgi:RHS repeat-associated protein
MRVTKGLCCLFLGSLFQALAFATPNPLPPVTGALAGTIAGSFDVSDLGAANFSVPIATLPGTAGVEPKLALVYDSHSGNGLAGVGWSLSGLSQITRCPNTVAQDGFIKGIDFSATDKFCMDGQRLVAINGTYGAHLTEYRTESDTFSRIVYDQSTGWQVRTKSGLRYEFGNSADAVVEAQGSNNVLLWRVNKISDTNGNYSAFSYFEDNANGESYPTRVDYTGNTNPPYNSVRFVYETRPDSSIGYFAGSKNSLTKRLKEVKLYYQETFIRGYQLAYDNSSVSSRSRLTEIKECDALGVCLNPTTFSWSNGSTAMLPQALTLTHGSFGQLYAASGHEDETLDLNNDGKGDRIWQPHHWWKYPQGLPEGYRMIAYSNGAGYEQPISYFPGNDLITPFYTYADADGDGDSDRIELWPASNSVKVALNNGSSFGSQTVWLQEQDQVVTNEYEGLPWSEKWADLNGDGRADHLYTRHEKVVASYSTGTTFTPAAQVIFPSDGCVGYSQGGSLEDLVDLNGDGLVDWIYRAKNCSDQILVALNNGNGFSTPTVWFNQNTLGMNIQEDYRMFGDVNGDGLNDFIWRRWGWGEVYVSISTGTGFLAPIKWMNELSVEGRSPWSGDHARHFMADMNSDGKADFVTNPDGQRAWYVLYSNGNDFHTYQKILPETVSYNGNTYELTHQHINWLDHNGDGLLDVTYVMDESEVPSLFLRLHDGEMPDLLKTITTGHGAQTKIEYKPLSDSAVYTKTYNTNDVYPTVELQGAMYVVSAYEVSNGVGGFNRYRYYYRGLKSELNGRGLSGFLDITRTDETTGIKTIVSYLQNFPFKGLVWHTFTRLADNTVVQETQHSWDVKYLNNNKTYFPFVEQSVTTDYELNGLLVKGSITDNEYDDYGNLTKQVMTFSDGSNTQTTENTYYNDTTNWFLGRLVTAMGTTETGTIDEVRLSTFEYSPTTGLLTKEVIEPGHPTLSLTKVYQHDSFGNIRFSTLSGPTIATRTTETIYSSDGRFAVEEVNALSQSVFKEYDPQSGVLINSTDANGLEVQKEYDSFGRLMHTYFPDGTENRTVYYLANGQGPANSVYYIRSDASGQQPIIKYFDVLDREIRTETIGFDGRKIFADKVYNNRGELVATSESYFENDPTVYWTTIQYDILGRNIQTTQPNGGVTSILYKEAQGQYIPREITNALNQKRTEYYDAQEMLRVIEDDLGHTVTYMYDQGSINGFTRALDPNGAILVLNKYDVLGNRTETTELNTGKTTFTYNELGQVLSQTDAKSQTVSFEYDLLGRTVERTEPEGITTWEYDTAPHGVGLLAAVVGINGYEEHYSYDALSRPYQTDTLVDGKSFSRSQSFDAYGRVQDVVYPYGFTVRNNYSSLGFLESITRLDTSLTLWTLNEATARGQMQKYTLGNGLVTQVAFYPATGLPQTIETGPAGIIQDLGFSFDALGNLQTRSDSNNNLAESFYYDSLNRLTDTQIAGGYSTHLTYNDNGNISYKSDVGTYTYGQNGAGLHAVTSIVGPKANTYTYDAVGNRLTSASDAGQVFYTSFNKPRKIKKGTTATVEYVYGPNQEKLIEIKTKSSLKETKYFIGTLYEHIEQARVIPGQGPKIVKHYNIYAGNHLIATIEEESPNIERTRYLHKDHLGSTQTVTDANGVVKEVLSYDAWGQRRNVDGTPAAQPIMSEIDQGFTGHEQIDEVGLIHMGGRVYDPIIGRFLSADPFVQSPENFQALNRYSYVLNNPLSAIDPSGFFFKKLFKALLKPFQPILKNEILSTIFTIAIASIPTFGPYLAASFQAANTYANGGSFLDGVKAAAISYAQSYAYNEIGGYYKEKNVQFGNYLHVEKVIAHGAVGGTASALQGGKFQHGFMSGAAAQFFAPAISENFQGADLKPVRVALAATVGGTASVMTGGKFANGAITGAFSRLFNDEGVHEDSNENFTGSWTEALYGYANAVSSGGIGYLRRAAWELNGFSFTENDYKLMFGEDTDAYNAGSIFGHVAAAPAQLGTSKGLSTGLGVSYETQGNNYFKALHKGLGIGFRIDKPHVGHAASTFKNKYPHPHFWKW